MLLFVIGFLVLVFESNRQQAKNQIDMLHQEFSTQQKSLLQAQVNHVKQQINYEREHANNLLQQSIQQRVNEAHAIASNIYNEHKASGEAEVTQRIADALRPIRFNQGRGYYYIYKMTGETVMHPVLPQNEGVNKIGLQDSRGAYIVRDMIQLIRQNDETFYNWWFVKPQAQDQEFEKIGFGKLFAPYDWFIGTGEYVVDVESDIQQQVLNYVQNIRFGENGFFFVYQYNGTTLAHRNNEWVGQNRLDALDQTGNRYVQDMIDFAQKSPGFVRYTSQFMPSTGQPDEKLAYVDIIPQWQWVIGTGIYTSELRSALQLREQQLNDENYRELRSIVALSSFMTLLLLAGSWLLGGRIANRFENFQSRIVSDFERLERTKDHMEFMALHDSLTGLPNRTYLHKKIEQGIARTKEDEQKLAVMFVDLDDFKKINDVHGHNAGDKLLQKLGMQFLEILGEHDSVSRFGGDEFIFCFPQLDSLRDAEKRVETILNIFNTTFEIDGKVLSSSCSAGIAMYPDDGHTPDELTTKADIVLYKSKSTQKGRVLFYDQAINRQVQYDFELESELRHALERHELSVHYQPQFRASDGKLVGIEALLRWSNPKLGEVSPDIFINVAEEIGLIHNLGLFVFAQACKDISNIRLALNNDIHLSINISPKQLLKPNFSDSLRSVLDSLKMSPSRITLEITENVFLNDFEQVKPILQDLRETGFGLSLDDFGTGYSSLSYINNLPLTEIKIDRTFTNKLLTSHQSETLILAIIAIGKASDMRVVAEGVETEDQSVQLKDMNCDWLQGYFFSRPLPYARLLSQYLTQRVND